MIGILETLQGKKPAGSKRSKHWRKVRNAYLKNNNRCVLCNGTKSLIVHHIKPFHTHPELELETDNLITLCEAKRYGVNCHLLFGHLGNFRRINESVVTDCYRWNVRIKNNGR